ncbi:PAM68-like protein (DUF3464) [Tasmannia lanceolata]|uniref:PAM68-like protein (DUF3464) n=1 Tax=Tasmannia lanceolata TaxID=3420 RepID=UPI0040649398
MESSFTILPNTPFISPRDFYSSKSSISLFPITLRKNPPQNHIFTSTRSSALKSPRGFGPSPEKKKKQKRREMEEEEDEDQEYEGLVDDTIPEIVTNRMMNRMGFSVGIPLVIGLLFFPFFYYLKVVVKLDIPTWVPFIVSLFLFGSALLGVSYGIVSSSWDPMREGSLLGWNEAQKNWPVFWQSLRGRTEKK